MTLETMDKIKFLSRTMDFSFELDAKPIFIPRNFSFDSHVSGSNFKSEYAFIGAGRDMKGYLFADGVNEKGFAIATLYFEENASFSKNKHSSKFNLAPEELVSWALGNVESVEDFSEKIKNLNIVALKNEVIGEVIPLHWIVSDDLGVTKCLEITKNGIHLYDNPVGVMTNSPEFPWHLTNLSHQNQFQPEEFSEKKYGSLENKSDGPGTGLLGLPGDFTAASRFLRTVVLKQYSTKVTGVYEGVNAVVHILNTVDIPKGVKVTNKKKDIADYTQYKGIMDISHRTYYMMPYDGFMPHKVALTDDLLKQTDPVEFDIDYDKKVSNLIEVVSSGNGSLDLQKLSKLSKLID